MPVVLTCGDPAGLGPELAVAARTELGDACPFLWLGDPRHLPEGARWQEIAEPEEAVTLGAKTLPVLRHDFPAAAAPGQPDPSNAPFVVEVIERATSLVRSGEASALCTAPVSKAELVRHAGFAHPGHTEYLAHLAGVEDVAMMLVGDDLRVVPATIHIALAEVPARLTPDRLATTLRLVHVGLIRDFGIGSPRIAVAGLNPHAGENGLMGKEEIEVIAPVIDALKAEGMDLIGPLPADTMFHVEARGGYDAAVAMYHDQALLPVKTLAFDRGVNVTLGLPFIRTSPDHGTGFDIAGRGVASPRSTIEALKLAAEMAARRQ